HPKDPQARVAPQLEDTAAWTACRREQIFTYLLQRQPQTLLLSDVGSFDDSQKAQLVDGILTAYEHGELHFGWHTRPYRSLAHPGLEQQLRPYITDKSKAFEARIAAVYMAEETRLDGLVLLLADVALDLEEDHAIRAGAARAVAESTDETARARLRPLALGQAGPDRDKQLQAIGLQATWPRHLTAHELFSALVDRASGDSFTYWSFVNNLREHLRSLLSAEHLAAALVWVASSAGGPGHGDLHEMRPEIVKYAWDELPDHPELLEPMARAILACLRELDRVLREEPDAEPFVDEDHGRRRRILRVCVSLLGGQARRRRADVFHLVSMLRQDDLPWILGQLPAATVEQRQVLAMLVEHVLPWGSAEGVAQLLEAANRFPVLCEHVRALKSVELDSDWARQRRRDHQRDRRMKQRSIARRNRIARLRQKRFDQTSQLLASAASGDLDAWWKANWTMLHLLDGGACSLAEWDLTASGFWKEAGADAKTSVLHVAERYLAAQHAWPTDWIRTNTIHQPAFAAYRALRLLQSQEPEALQRIPADRWPDLAPVILGYPLLNGEESSQQHTGLVRQVHQTYPDDVVRWICQRAGKVYQ
ncbi:hypothetical protein LCGC14_2235120, partial [marine sediment metagenome]